MANGMTVAHAPSRYSRAPKKAMATPKKIREYPPPHVAAKARPAPTNARHPTTSAALTHLRRNTKDDGPAWINPVTREPPHREGFGAGSPHRGEVSRATVPRAGFAGDEWGGFVGKRDRIGTRVPVRATVSGSTLRLIVTSLTMTSISSAMSRS